MFPPRQAAEALSASGAHRIAVVDPEKDEGIQGIVTPCGILRAIRDHVTELGELAAVPTGCLFDISTPVMTAHQNLAADRAFRKLLSNEFSGAPVVNDHGAMVAALSFGNLRSVATLTPEAARGALETHSVYWMATRDANGDEDKRAMMHNMTVLPTDSLATAIAMLAYSRAHRMYIVDKNRRPIGIITIRKM